MAVVTGKRARSAPASAVAYGRAYGLTDDQIKHILTPSRPVYRVNVPGARICEQCGTKNAYLVKDKADPFAGFTLCDQCKSNLRAAMPQVAAVAGAYAAFLRADDAWQAELAMRFGRRAADVRYTSAGRGYPGSSLRAAYDALAVARAAYEAVRAEHEATT